MEMMFLFYTNNISREDRPSSRLINLQLYIETLCNFEEWEYFV